MKKVGRDPGKLETLNLFSLLQDEDSGSLSAPERRETFTARLNSGLDRALNSPSTLHGVRAQTMFEGMVASLGKVKLLKQEDAGECYFAGDQIRIPDFRVVTKSGSVLLIEAKSHYPSDPMADFRIRAQDLEALQRYTAFFGTPLRFAIYWAHWNQWTLTRPEDFGDEGKQFGISFQRAMTCNEMADLGDFTIATRYPLSLKMVVDPHQPREIDTAGIAMIHVLGTEVSCAGTRINDRVGRNVALYLMMYGKWEYDGGKVETDDEGLPTAVVHSVAPTELLNANERFEMVGSLSSLYSSLFNSLTLEEGVVTKLRVEDPTALAPVIPIDWTSDDLPLWRFVLQANRDEVP